MKLATSSGLPLLKLCPASSALPHVHTVSTKATIGDALHLHMDQRAKYGVAEAMARCDDVARQLAMGEKDARIFSARASAFEFCPPRGAFGEVGLAFLDDGSVIPVDGGKGRYTIPDGVSAVYAGTVDAMWSEPEPLDLRDPTHPRCPPGSILWCAEYKSGEDRYVTAVDHNAQVAANALSAARWTGAERVIPAIIFIRNGQGDWDVPLSPDGRAMPWGSAELAAHERMLRGIVRDAREQQRQATANEPLSFTVGSHCEYCPGRARCSAHTAQLKMIVSGEVAPVGDAPLTDTQLSWLADHLGAFERVSRQIRAALRADVEANGRPIPMGNGNVWGPHAKDRTTILAEAAIHILQEELGTHAAMVVSQEVSRDAIEVAAKAVLAEQGLTRGVSPFVRRIFAKLGEVGALVTESKETWGAHRPAEPSIACRATMIDDDEELE